MTRMPLSILVSAVLLSALAVDFQPLFAQDGSTPPPPRPRRAYSTIDNYNYSHGGDVAVEKVRKPKKKKAKKTVVKTTESSSTTRTGLTGTTTEKLETPAPTSKITTTDKSAKTEKITTSDNSAKTEKVLKSEKTGDTKTAEATSARPVTKPVIKRSRDFADTIMTGKGSSKESADKSVSEAGGLSSGGTSSGGMSTGVSTGEVPAGRDVGRVSTGNTIPPTAVPVKTAEDTSDDLTAAKLSAIPKPQMPPPPTSIGGFSTKSASKNN